MKPWRHESGADDAVVWGGWARMALPLNTCSIVEVAKPRIGEKAPAIVRADIGLTLPKRGDLRAEWETLRRHDACFLLTVRPDAPAGTRYDVRLPFKEQIRVAFVRGCTIDGMIGPDGKVGRTIVHVSL
jgi:intron-binding protein aquarius